MRASPPLWIPAFAGMTQPQVWWVWWFSSCFRECWGVSGVTRMLCLSIRWASSWPLTRRMCLVPIEMVLAVRAGCVGEVGRGD